jgi:hypothetical protein
MPYAYCRNKPFALLVALCCLALVACSQTTSHIHRSLHSSNAFVVWQPKRVRLDASCRWRLCINHQRFEYNGTFMVNGLGVFFCLHRDTPRSAYPYIAAQYTWAGPHRVIYAHQPSWVLTVVRDLHRVVDLPRTIKVRPAKYHPGQQGTARQASGDLTKLYFINSPKLPWRVVVTCPDGSRIKATFSWTEAGRLRAVYLNDTTAHLDLHIRLFQHRKLVQ